MDKGQEYILGIDTSNYTTSVALVDRRGEVLADQRRILEVKEGQRGLRQSHALFQHTVILPELLEQAMEGQQGRLCGVAASVAPRSVEGSYMPVFQAGSAMARGLATTHGIPFFEFSHQEGHIESVRPVGLEHFYAFHLSGGTCELLEVSGKEIRILGQTKDISFGQLIDRVGVRLGMTFPAGKELDQWARRGSSQGILKKIPVKQGDINLSGMETQCQRQIDQGISGEDLAAEIFEKIAEAINEMMGEKSPAVLMGGVAESQTLRCLLGEKGYFFPKPHRARDNAVGIALLGRKMRWP